MKYLYTFIFLLFIINIYAQENWDIDSFFDYTEDLEIETEDSSEITVFDVLKQRSITFSASYEFLAGVSPGWYKHPWDPEYIGERYLDRYLKMKTSFSLDSQVSKSFRVFSSLSFEIPIFSFLLGDFYFDYIMFNKLYIRGGKYAHSWGISPNYTFTNLLARVPVSGYSGESYVLKADYPIGKGGLQLLTLTRALDLGELPNKEDFGLGGKYNLAFSFADFDLGVYYKNDMPLRGFLSVKTTLFDTELYAEGLLAGQTENSPTSGAVNFGFARDFFNGKLGINAEFCYNNEKDTYYYRPQTNIQEEGTYQFVEDISLTLNLSFKPSVFGDLRFYLNTMYNPTQKSGMIFPGLRINPVSHIEISLGVPVILGNKEGYFYQNTLTYGPNGEPLPFAIIFLVTLSGSLHLSTTF